MKNTLSILFLALHLFTAKAQLNMQLLDQLSYPVSLNDIWGWANPATGAEYALVGTRTGVSIVDVTVPTNIQEVQFIPGANSTWRDIKYFGNYAYATNETGGGLLVINMAGAPNNITWEYKVFNIPGWGNLTDCHNLYIDEFGYCYLAGCNLNSGRMLVILDVFTNPANPVLVHFSTTPYAHDYFARNNLLFASEIYEGDLGIYDVSNKNNIVKLASQPTPYNFTHNAWSNDNNSVVFTTDEKANAPIAAYDITDLSDIRELDQFRPVATLGANVIPHNVHVWDNWLIISYYTDGGVIADASRPENIIEVGNWDTFLGGNGGFNGAWGAYPFLPSGIVLLTDIGNGLYVCGANYVRACWLEGRITNAMTGAPIFNAQVSIASTQANGATTDFTGNYKTGQAIPGTFQVTFSAPGYISKTLPAVLQNGVLTILDVQLQPIIIVPQFAGQVLSAVDGAPVAAAQVVLESSSARYTTTTNAIGQFVFNNINRDEYTLAAAKWGFLHSALHGLLVEPNTSPVTLRPHLGYQDDFFSSQGWTTQTTASGGWWTRGIPVGTSLNGQLANPDADVPEDIGNQCFMTGNNGGAAGTDDVDNGHVRLISPVMDGRIYHDPVVSYRAWFVNGGNATPPNDTFEVRISNGAEEVVLETITTSNPAWNDRSMFRLADHIALTNTMRIIFEAKDDSADPHIVEAAVDAFLMEESAFPPFLFSENEGCPVLAVGFAEMSGLAYQWEWSFENGLPSTSNAPATTVDFSVPGSHHVSLTVKTKTGADFTVEMPGLVQVLAPPVADFSFTDVAGEVFFENTSAHATSYLWVFNDGTGATSDEPDPVHSFPSAGQYEVVLTAENECGTATHTTTVFVAAVPPEAGFSASQNVVCQSVAVQFFDLSTHVPTAWEWSFPGGNPAVSTDQNPVVFYPVAGNYPVQLTVTNSAGTSTIFNSDFILVNAPPVAGFGFLVQGPTVTFDNLSTDAVSYQWQFNDGLGSITSEASPTHVFPNIGSYEVFLRAENDCGSDEINQAVAITAVQPSADFTLDADRGCAPFTVQLQDISSGGEISSWEWTFPGGSPASFSGQAPQVTYSQAGVYDIGLKVTNPVGVSETWAMSVVVVEDVPTASFDFLINGPSVAFVNNSANATGYTWHFGDALQSTSTTADPTFFYGEIGTYTVLLQAVNHCGISVSEQLINISEILPNAAFQINQNMGCAPMNVSFSDHSTGGGLFMWEWLFPGGTPASSTAQNPDVIYTISGIYDVTLRVKNSVGESVFVQTAAITVNDVPVPDFDFIVNGSEVIFSNNSQNSASQIWHFGDAANTTSDEPDPVFDYQTPGTYTVMLEAFNDCGSSVVSAEILIAFMQPQAGVVATNNVGCAPLLVTFSDGSTGGGIHTWAWEFPGGAPATSNEPSPTVVYDLPGTYPVSLTVTNPTGESSTTVPGLVEVGAGPQAGFDFWVNGPTVHFTNISQFSDQFEWDMGDGAGVVSTETNPVHTFPGVGSYEVNLIATNACGTSVYSSTVVILSPTGTTTSSGQAVRLEVMPNPFAVHSTIRYELALPHREAKFVLVNVLGEMVWEQRMNHQAGETTIGENLGAGAYFLQLWADGRVVGVVKMIKL